MPKDRKFLNPLTQRSDTLPSTSTLPSTETSPSTESETLPSTETSTSTFTSTYTQTAQRKRGAMAFEKTHERVTLWLLKSYKRRFETLAEEQGIAKSALLDEAIRDLLDKYNVP